MPPQFRELRMSNTTEFWRCNLATVLGWKRQRLLCTQLWMSTLSGTQQSKLSVKNLLQVTNIYLKIIFKARDRLKFLLSSKFFGSVNLNEPLFLPVLTKHKAYHDFIPNVLPPKCFFSLKNKIFFDTSFKR